MIPQVEKLIVFDGTCNLCNSWVQFVIKRDPEQQIKFCALQSELGKKIHTHFLQGTPELSTVIYIRKNKLYIKSSAALHIFKSLNGFWSMWFVLISIPKPLRDFVYDFVAKNRTKWFGKTEQCMVPSAETAHLFLEKFPTK